MDEKMIRNYSRILKEELVPAMGCTEPISIAYAAAVARETLGCPAERIALEVSGNIIKNVKSVTVPMTIVNLLKEKDELLQVFYRNGKLP